MTSECSCVADPGNSTPTGWEVLEEQSDLGLSNTELGLLGLSGGVEHCLACTHACLHAARAYLYIPTLGLGMALLVVLLLLLASRARGRRIVGSRQKGPTLCTTRTVHHLFSVLC